jgi:membrane-bound serine protease (ClpP class)
VSAEQALELGAIDLISPSLDDLLDQLDGRTVTVNERVGDVVLRTAEAAVDEHEMGFFRSIQQRLADPTLAFLFLSIGTLGLIYELASPGIGAGGIVGVSFILLAMFGLAVLPVNAVGVAFLVLAIALFVAEVFAPGIGVMAAGGAVALALSGMFLIRDAPGLEVSLLVVGPVALTVAIAVVLAGRVALRARKAPSTLTGTGLFVGHEVPVRMVHGHPAAVVEGAWWSLRSDGAPLSEGQIARVVAVDGLDLVVEPVAPPGERPPPESSNEPADTVQPEEST